MRKESEFDYKFTTIILSVICIINTVITIRAWTLYEPLATIVLHDYGTIFESEIDWKLWRIEHNK